MGSNKGFTIIELVVVIVIIGILAATALPRFVNLTDDAHSASVEATASSFRSGINLSHASWIAKGAHAGVNSIAVEGGGTIGVTDAGWPQNAAAGGGDGSPDTNDCMAIWNGLLSPAPGIATDTSADWQVSIANTDNCRFAYNAAPGRQFDYDVGTGVVTITVP